MRIKTRIIDGYIVRIIEDDHKHMWIGKFDSANIDNVYADTEGELYDEIYKAIAKHQGNPIPEDDED